jgi:hypothetical protein
MARKPIDTVQLKLRFSEALRRRLEREAKKQERSLNAEIVTRLEQSFRKSEEAELVSDTLQAAFGAVTGDLLRSFATAIWLVEKHTGKKWNEDRITHMGVYFAIDYINQAFFRPLSATAVARRVQTNREWDAKPDRSYAGIFGVAHNAALDTLRKMDMAPSDEEVAEAANLLTSQTENDGDAR